MAEYFNHFDSKKSYKPSGKLIWCCDCRTACVMAGRIRADKKETPTAFSMVPTEIKGDQQCKYCGHYAVSIYESSLFIPKQKKKEGANVKRTYCKR